ncbi:hypothetical protein HN51_015926 [Arachis hypogaea]
MLSHKAVHLIQGINEQKVHSIFCSSNALWIPCHNKEGINLASFLSENKANRLLTEDPNQRLGARGASEVKEHVFFKDINWDTLAR